MKMCVLSSLEELMYPSLYYNYIEICLTTALLGLISKVGYFPHQIRANPNNMSNASFNAHLGTYITNCIDANHILFVFLDRPGPLVKSKTHVEIFPSKRVNYIKIFCLLHHLRKPGDYFISHKSHLGSQKHFEH